MKILFACAKADFGPRATAACAAAQKFVGAEHQVIDAQSIGWADVQRAEGGWEGGYRWAARAHDACIVLETAEGGLGRGTFEIAQNFLLLKKRVGVLRDGKVVRVGALQKSLAGDWKLNWGAAIAEGECSR